MSKLWQAAKHLSNQQYISSTGSLTIYYIFEEICDVLINALIQEGFSRTNERYAILAHGFSQYRRNANSLSRCIGPLDAVSIRIRKPDIWTAPIRVATSTVKVIMLFRSMSSVTRRTNSISCRRSVQVLHMILWCYLFSVAIACYGTVNCREAIVL